LSSDLDNDARLESHFVGIFFFLRPASFCIGGRRCATIVKLNATAVGNKRPEDHHSH
jgi:hypothetical protein